MAYLVGDSFDLDQAPLLGLVFEPSPPRDAGYPMGAAFFNTDTAALNLNIGDEVSPLWAHINQLSPQDTSLIINRAIHAYDTIRINYGTQATNVGLSTSMGISEQAARADHVHAHANQPGGSLHALASDAAHGFMSSIHYRAVEDLPLTYAPLNHNHDIHTLLGLAPDGTIPSDMIPAIAIAETFVANSQAEMLALPADVGDIAVRTDISTTFILQKPPPQQLDSWVQLLSPVNVLSVNGKTGTVMLVTDDIAEGPTPANLWFTQARVIAAPLTGIVFTDGTAITAADTIVQAFGKLQKQITNLNTGGSTSYVWNQLAAAQNPGNLWISGTGRLNTLQADTSILVGTGTGTQGGNDNLIRPYATSAHLNLKGGTGAAKIDIGNDSLWLVSGGGAYGIAFQGGATPIGIGTQFAQMFGTTGNWVYQSGGTFTDAGYRADIFGNVRITGQLTVTNRTGGAAVSPIGVDATGRIIDIPYPDFSPYVTLGTVQTITAQKTFQGTSNQVIIKNSTDSSTLTLSVAGASHFISDSLGGVISFQGNGNINIQTGIGGLQLGGTNSVITIVSDTNLYNTGGGPNSDSRQLRFNSTNAAGSNITTVMKQVGGDTRIIDIDAHKFRISSTQALTLPAGSTAQRPTILITGDLRYSTSFATLEFYDGTGWKSIVTSSVIPSIGLLDTSASTAQTPNTNESFSNNIVLHRIAKTGTYSDLIGSPVIPTVGALNTTITTSLATAAAESFGGTIQLHKVSKTGAYADLVGLPIIPAPVNPSDFIQNQNYTAQNAGFKISNIGEAAGFISNGSFNAMSGFAYGNNFSPTLTATANGDMLVALNIQPTFNVGSFTGTLPAALRLGGGIRLAAHYTYDAGSNGFAFANIHSQNAVIDNIVQRGTTTTFYSSAIVAIGRLYSTGNWILQNGGTFTDNGTDRLQVTGTGVFSGTDWRALIGLAGASNRITLETSLTTNSSGSFFRGGTYRGTSGAKTAVQTGDQLASFLGAGYYDGTNIYDGVSIRLGAAENWSATSRGTNIQFYTTQNGTITTAIKFAIGSDGSLVHSGNRTAGTIANLLAVDTANKIVDAPASYLSGQFITNQLATPQTGDFNITGIGIIGNKFGIQTIAPTHALTMSSTASADGFVMYNTADQTTNYERVRQYYNNSIFKIQVETGGTGLSRAIQLISGSKTFTSFALTPTPQGAFAFDGSSGNTTNNYSTVGLYGTYTQSSNTYNLLSIIPTINQSGTGGYRGIWISPYEQAIGTGAKYLIDTGVNSAANGSGTHTSKFVVDNAGNVGLLTPSPTHTLTLANTATGIAYYNTADQLVNYERLRMVWATNVFMIGTERAGGGVLRDIRITNVASTEGLTITPNNNIKGRFQMYYDGIGGGSIAGVLGTLGGNGVITQALSIIPTINQSGAAGYKGIWISIFEQAPGTGSKYLIDAGTNAAANGGGFHTAKFLVDNQGNTAIAGTLTVQSRAGGGPAVSALAVDANGRLVDTVLNPAPDLSAYVTIATVQDITGAKTFKTSDLTYAAKVVGTAGGARNVFLAGQEGFSNGFSVIYTGSEMEYKFLNGNVGIGKNPGERLDVLGNIQLSGNIYVGGYTRTPELLLNKGTTAEAPSYVWGDTGDGWGKRFPASSLGGNITNAVVAGALYLGEPGDGANFSGSQFLDQTGYYSLKHPDHLGQANWMFWGYGNLWSVGTGTGYTSQIALYVDPDFATNRAYIRTSHPSSGFNSPAGWTELWHSGNANRSNVDWTAGTLYATGNMAGSLAMLGKGRHWGDGTYYPTLQGTAGEQFIMIIHPHIPFLIAGGNGYPGSISHGAIVRHGANSTGSGYWDSGVANADIYSISRNGAGALFSIESSGKVTVANTLTSVRNTVVEGMMYDRAHFEARTTNGSNPAFAFHAAGYYAAAIYYSSDAHFRYVDSSGSISTFWTTRNFTPANMGDYATMYYVDNKNWTFLKDTRGISRSPDNGEYITHAASWHFQSKDDTGAGGDYWNGLLNVVPWSGFDPSHRQQQLAFTGTGGLRFRYALSANGWGAWQTIWTSDNLPIGVGYRSTDLNTYLGYGLFFTDGAITNGPIATANMRILGIGEWGRWTQMIFDWTSDRVWFRRMQDSYFTTWCEFWHSGNANRSDTNWSTGDLYVGGMAYMGNRLGVDMRYGYTTPTISLAIGDYDTGFHAVGDGNTVYVSNGAWKYSMLDVPGMNRWYDGWVNAPGYDANTIQASKSGFTYSNNAPLAGCLVYFDAGGYGFQFNTNYQYYTRIFFRAHNGDVGVWNPWYEFYTTQNLSFAKTDWSGTTMSEVTVGYLKWRNYGNGHIIFDASNGTSPTGSGINAGTAEIAWTGSFPCLMGWNGSNTYGVRVDSARYADSAGSAPASGGTSTYTEYVNNDSASMRFHWSGQGGQPTWLWGSNDASNVYLYNPSNFSVNYANSAGSANTANITSNSYNVVHNYSRTDGTRYNVVWASGNPSPMYSCDAVQILSSSGILYANEFYRNSSRRNKTNEQIFTGNALEFLDNVVIKTYNKKDSGEFGIGFIAEDTHEWLSGTKRDGHNMGSHLSLLTKAVQELKAENEMLKSRIKVLEGGSYNA